MTSGADVPLPLEGAGPAPHRVARPWVDAYPPGVPPTYGYPDVLLTRFLDDAVRDFPDADAVDTPRATLTYAELADVVDRLAGALEGLGVHHGRPLGLLLDRGPAFVVSCFAAWRLGAVVVPVDPGRPDDVVRDRLAGSAAEVLVTAPSGIDRVGSSDGWRGALRVIVTSEEDWLPKIRRPLARLRARRDGTHRRLTSDMLRFRDIVDTAPPRAAQRHADGRDAAAVLFDRDGEPLVLSHRHLVAAAFQSRLWVPDVQAGRERVLVVSPTDQPAALVAGLLDPVLSAAAIVIVASDEPDAVAERVEAGAPTLLGGPAELFSQLAGGSADLSSPRAGLAITGRLDAATVDRFGLATGGARLRRAYGPVAAAGLSHANPVYGRASPEAIGLPVTDTVACVVAPDDPTTLVPVGEVGRLLVRGPQVTARRWTPPGAASSPPPAGGADGWLDTGDLARVDEEGWFTLVGEDAAGARVTGNERAADGTLTVSPGREAPDDEEAR